MQFITVNEAAIKLEKSPQTIRRWAASGKLAAQKRSNRWQILSTEICNPSSQKRPITQTVLLQDAVGKIAEAVLQKISAAANSSSRELELQKEVDRLSQENKQIKSALHKVCTIVKQLKEEQKKLREKITTQEHTTYEKTSQIVSTPAIQPAAQLNSHSKEEIMNSEVKIADEEKAERWAKNNTNKWLDQHCRAGRTWRELATNVGELVSIRGRSQKPRSHLHIIMKVDKSAWNRMKAKVALEMFPSEKLVSSNHYAHSMEAGEG